MKTTEEKVVDWEAFDMKKEERLKLVSGKKYELGFSGIRQDVMTVEEEEKTAEGTVKVQKEIPSLVLTVDCLDGNPANIELVVTSKRLAQVVRTYFQKNMLFTRVFELSREGEKMQTKYQMIALDDKPKAPSPVNPQGGEKSTQEGQGPQAPPSGGKRDRAPEDAGKSSVRETDRDEIGAFVN